MGLLDVLRAGIKTADKITKPLQANVSYVRVTARDAYGAPSAYATAVTLKAIVDQKQRPVRTRSGIETVSSATLTFLDVAVIARVTNSQGIDSDDQFTLPDGTTSKVLALGGFVDAGTAQPVATEVMLG